MDYVREVSEKSKFPERVSLLCEKFEKKFSTNCQFICSAPGRINLIGEHIDYMGYGVLPAAIKQSTLCGVSFKKNAKIKGLKITISNESEDFEVVEKTFKNCKAVTKMDLSKKHHWTNYVLCGLKGIIMEKLSLDRNLILPNIDISLLISGNVPIGKGLSSSSSINCSCVLAYLKIFNLKLKKTQIAQLAVKVERFIGIAGGGMDQTISIFGEKHFAKFIEFLPCLKISKRVEICSGYQFVVCDSMVESNKSESASKYYNVRVIECRLGSAIIGKKYNIEGWKEVRTLYELQRDMKVKKVNEMVEKVKSSIEKEVMNVKEIAKFLGMKVSTMRKKYFMNNNKIIKLQNENHLKLRSRCIHVFSEAQRVHHFIQNSKNPKVLGDLLNKSYFSCRDNYEASCDELEILTTLCRKNGALGSRFTGAGWGGCCISLVKNEDVEKFIEKIWKDYYVKRNLNKKIKKEKMNTVLFKTQAETGALIYICTK